jgi:hypothetical protein
MLSFYRSFAEGSLSLKKNTKVNDILIVSTNIVQPKYSFLIKKMNLFSSLVDDDDMLSKSHNPLTNVAWDDETEVQSTAKVDLDQSTSEDLSITSFTLVDELFLELFYRGIKQDSSQNMDNNTSIFTQLNQDQRELFRKIIKHFCNLDKRLDDMLDL